MDKELKSPKCKNETELNAALIAKKHPPAYAVGKFIPLVVRYLRLNIDMMS